MTYRFRTTSLDSSLLPQIAAALEQHTQRLSREKYPKLWQTTDKLNQNHTPAKTRSNFLSVVCLLLGLFLFIPGLMKPQELLMPLLAGAIGIGTGIGGLIRGSKKSSPFVRSAKKLSKLYVVGAEVFFTDSGMKLANEAEIPYQEISPLIETQDCLFFVFGERYLLLQKKDCLGHITDFQTFISGKLSI